MKLNSFLLLTMKSLITFIIVFIPLASHAQKAWTLRECIDYAQENNVDIKQQLLSVKQTDTELSLHKGSRLPNFHVGSSQMFNFGRSQSLETGIYEDIQTFSTSLSGSMSINLFSGFSVLNSIRSAKFHHLASLENLQKNRDNLEVQVTYLYLDILLKKEILSVYEIQSVWLQEEVERMYLLVESGRVAKSLLFDINTLHAELHLSLVTARGDLDVAILNLSQALNITDTPFLIQFPDITMENFVYIESPDTIFNETYELQSVTREIKLKVQRSISNLKIARASRWPSITLHLSYISGFSYTIHSSGETNYSKPGIIRQLKNNQRQSIGLTVNLPVFNRLQARSQIQTAINNSEGLSIEQERLKTFLYHEIQQAHQRATTAKFKYNAAKAALNATTESWLCARESYLLGKLTVHELNEMHIKLISAESELLRSKYEYVFNVKVIRFFKGEHIIL